MQVEQRQILYGNKKFISAFIFDRVQLKGEVPSGFFLAEFTYKVEKWEKCSSRDKKRLLVVLALGHKHGPCSDLSPFRPTNCTSKEPLKPL